MTHTPVAFGRRTIITLPRLVAVATVVALAVVGGVVFDDDGPGPHRPANQAAAASAPADRTGGVGERQHAKDSRARLKFPTARTAGVPARWRPKRTIRGRDKVIRKKGAVVKNLRVVNGDIIVAARNVTIRRVEVLGGSIGNWEGPTCSDGLVIRSTTVARAPGQVTSDEGAAISTGSYKAIDVKIDDLPEGFRIGGKPEGCGRVVIKDSYARVTAPDECGDWHGDALQGYEGAALKVRNSRLNLVWREDCEGTASFFYPDQGNTSVDIDRLLVEGSRYYSFRLHTPGEVRNLKVLRGRRNGGIDVDCSLITAWSAHMVRLNKHDQPRNVRKLRCD
jgi:hypothetical protein